MYSNIARISAIFASKIIKKEEVLALRKLLNATLLRAIFEAQSDPITLDENTRIKSKKKKCANKIMKKEEVHVKKRGARS